MSWKPSEETFVIILTQVNWTVFKVVLFFCWYSTYSTNYRGMNKMNSDFVSNQRAKTCYWFWLRKALISVTYQAITAIKQEDAAVTIGHIHLLLNCMVMSSKDNCPWDESKISSKSFDLTCCHQKMFRIFTW